MTTTEHRSRVLSWQNCLNSRDLGGYESEDGRLTLWGQIVRCDNPARLNNAGCAEVWAYGVRTIVDLRKPEEIAAHPNPLVVCRPEIAYVNVSLIDPMTPLRPAHALPPREFVSLAADYVDMLEQYSQRIVDVMHAISSASNGGIMINCMGGKDRTGLISAMLLALAGVPDSIIAQDYALSRKQLQTEEDAYLAGGPGSREDRERAVQVFAAREEVMLDVLEVLRARHGGVSGYLRHAGIDPPEVDAIRVRLIG